MDTTSNESVLYGKEWNNAHQGYFSDPGIAAPLVEAVMEVCSLEKPDVIADLGGGTGVVLKRLLAEMKETTCGLVAVDVSGVQLEQVEDERIRCVKSPVEKLERRMLIEGDGSLLLFMRSLLHYFGKDGLRDILRHLRGLLRDGEYLVHQSACFENVAQSRIANDIYARIGTGKWYPTVAELASVLAAEGFNVDEIRHAPRLVLPGDELRDRYNVDSAGMERMGRELIEKYEQCPGVFEYKDGDFTLYLNYHILTCVAV